MMRCWCHVAMAAWQESPVGGGRVSPEATARWRAECERAGGDCAARVEAVALRMPLARAFRRANALEVYTLAGVRTYPDAAAAGEMQYRYLGMPSPNAHLLWRGTASCAAFVVLDVYDAQETPYIALVPALQNAAFARRSTCLSATA